jgi:hypothetical protein
LRGSSGTGWTVRVRVVLVRLVGAQVWADDIRRLRPWPWDEFDGFTATSCVPRALFGVKRHESESSDSGDPARGALSPIPRMRACTGTATPGLEELAPDDRRDGAPTRSRLARRRGRGMLPPLGSFRGTNTSSRATRVHAGRMGPAGGRIASSGSGGRGQARAETGSRSAETDGQGQSVGRRRPGAE